MSHCHDPKKHDHKPLIALNNIDLFFGRNHVLQGITTELHKGCITTLIGPNGAGKTTLVRVVLGLQKPTSGSIWKEDGLRIGYMPQKLLIDKTFPLTVERFLLTSQCTDKHKLEQATSDVGCNHLLRSSIHNLSGGEMQRVLLARALLRDPQLLVLDEPVQGVDINGQLELYNLIARIRDERGCGVLMISHDLHLVMAATDHVVCINHHVCCSGHPEQVDMTLVQTHCSELCFNRDVIRCCCCCCGGFLLLTVNPLLVILEYLDLR